MSRAGLVAVALGLMMWMTAPAWWPGPFTILAGLVFYGAAQLDTYMHTHYPDSEDL